VEPLALRTFLAEVHFDLFLLSDLREMHARIVLAAVFTLHDASLSFTARPTHTGEHLKSRQ
jgi:hypothetical protein